MSPPAPGRLRCVRAPQRCYGAESSRGPTLDRIAFFREYLDDKPGDRFASYSLALELKKAGRADEAETAFRELLALHPTSGAGHYQLGLLLEEQDRDDAARTAWEAGLAALDGLTDVDARRSRGDLQSALDAL